MKKNLLNLLLVLTGFSVFAQPTRTVKDGNWSDPTVWDRGVPSSTLSATVRHNVTVDINADVLNLLDITPGGSLNNSSRILSIWGNLVVSEPSRYNETGTARTELRGETSTISGKVTFNMLRIYKNRNTMSVTANDTLFVKNYFSLFRGDLNVGTAALVLLANSTQESRMGYSVNGRVLGTFIWQKFINRCNEWSTYTTPIAATLEQIAANSEGRMVYTGFPGGVDYPNYTFINTYFYNEATGYQEPTSTTNTVNKGQGFWYWNSNEVTSSNQSSIPQQWLIELSQNGLNTGLVGLDVSFSTDGFNLVGNPFPGLLNWNGPWTKTNIEDAIYYWNTCTQSYASYVNGVGTNGGNQWIPSGQGFFVQATTSNPVLIADTRALALNSVANKTLKSGNTEEQFDENEETYPFISLKFNDDETIVRFTENASTDFDNGKDARKILTPSYVPDNSSIRTVLNGVNYSINAVPVEDLIIPLDVKGQGELTFTGANQFSDIDIYLEDRLTGELIDMKANQSYVFDNSATGYTHRFNIITKKSVLSTSTLNEQRLSVYPNPYSDVVTIMTNGQAFDKVEVYNILGELVMSETNTGLTSRQINVSKLNTGTYIIKVYNQNNEVGTFLTQKQ